MNDNSPSSVFSLHGADRLPDVTGKAIAAGLLDPLDLRSEKS